MQKTQLIKNLISENQSLQVIRNLVSLVSIDEDNYEIWLAEDEYGVTVKFIDYSSVKPMYFQYIVSDNNVNFVNLYDLPYMNDIQKPFEDFVANKLKGYDSGFLKGITNDYLMNEI